MAQFGTKEVPEQWMRVRRWMDFDHLSGMPRYTSSMCANLADIMIGLLAGCEDRAEVTVGLRKILEAKDCFVRASMTLPKSENALLLEGKVDPTLEKEIQ